MVVVEVFTQIVDLCQITTIWEGNFPENTFNNLTNNLIMIKKRMVMSGTQMIILIKILVLFHVLITYSQVRVTFKIQSQQMKILFMKTHQE